MKATTALVVAIAAAAFAGPANAVFKCTTAKGVVYQDRPCREGNETDVRITMPTGELAPKATAAGDEGGASNAARSDDRTPSMNPVRPLGDGPKNPTKRAEQKTDGGATAADGRRKDALVTIERTTPMTSDQARKSEPSAKYYATESFSTGNETPVQMNCETPAGEKRMFYLSDGKLTTI